MGGFVEIESPAASTAWMGGVTTQRFPRSGVGSLRIPRSVVYMAWTAI